MQKKSRDETWNEQKEHLKEKITALTDTNILFLAGKEEEMIAKLQVKLGLTRQELDQIIKAL